MLRYNNTTNEVEAYYASTNSWRDIATIDDINAQSNVFINIGTGVEVYKQKNVSNEQEFRKINVSGALSVVQNTSDITISDTLTASNLGTGAEIFKSRVTNDLQFRKLKSSNNSVTITENANDIDLTIPGVGNTTLTTTDVTSTPALFNGLVLSPGTNKTWFFKIYVLAGQAQTNRAWQIQGVVQDINDIDSFVGAVSRIDYQRNTGELLINPWNATTAYSTGDQVEHDLIIYQAINNISANTPSSYTSPDTNSDWTVIDAGWNATVAIFNNQLSIRVRGDTSTVNWSVKLEYVEL